MLRRGSGPWRAECQALFLARARAGAWPVAFGRRGIWTARGDSRPLRICQVDHKPRETPGGVFPRGVWRCRRSATFCLPRNLPRWRMNRDDVLATFALMKPSRDAPVSCDYPCSDRWPAARRAATSICAALDDARQVWANRAHGSIPCGRTRPRRLLDAQSAMARVQAFVERLISASAGSARKTTRCASGAFLQHGALFEAVVATIANDDVVNHVDAEQRPGRDQPTCQLDVVSARTGIAAWVIVRQDDRPVFDISAARNTSRGCTSVASSVPRLTSW